MVEYGTVDPYWEVAVEKGVIDAVDVAVEYGAVYS